MAVMIHDIEANDKDDDVEYSDKDESYIPLNKHPDEVDEDKLEESSKGESEADDVIDVQGGGVTHLMIG